MTKIAVPVAVLIAWLSCMLLSSCARTPTPAPSPVAAERGAKRVVPPTDVASATPADPGRTAGTPGVAPPVPAAAAAGAAPH